MPLRTNRPWGCQDSTLASGPFAQPRLQPHLWVCSVLMAHFYMYVMRSIAYTAWEGIIKRAFQVCCVVVNHALEPCDKCLQCRAASKKKERSSGGHLHFPCSVLSLTKWPSPPLASCCDCRTVLRPGVGAPPEDGGSRQLSR